MKYISVILAIILFMPVLRTCKGAIWEHDIWFSQKEIACSIEHKGATCCSKIKMPVEDNHHEKERDCGDSCCCYCCTTVIMQSLASQPNSIETASTPPILWMKNGYIHEFNNLIWQPPPFYSQNI